MYRNDSTGVCLECGCSVGSSKSECSSEGRCTCDSPGAGNRPELADGKCVSILVFPNFFVYIITQISSTTSRSKKILLLLDYVYVIILKQSHDLAQ